MKSRAISTGALKTLVQNAVTTTGVCTRVGDDDDSASVAAQLLELDGCYSRSGTGDGDTPPSSGLPVLPLETVAKSGGSNKILTPSPGSYTPPAETPSPQQQQQLKFVKKKNLSEKVKNIPFYVAPHTTEGKATTGNLSKVHLGKSKLIQVRNIQRRIISRTGRQVIFNDANTTVVTTPVGGGGAAGAGRKSPTTTTNSSTSFPMAKFTQNVEHTFTHKNWVLKVHDTLTEHRNNLYRMDMLKILTARSSSSKKAPTLSPGGVDRVFVRRTAKPKVISEWNAIDATDDESKLATTNSGDKDSLPLPPPPTAATTPGAGGATTPGEAVPSEQHPSASSEEHLFNQQQTVQESSKKKKLDLPLLDWQPGSLDIHDTLSGVKIGVLHCSPSLPFPAGIPEYDRPLPAQAKKMMKEASSAATEEEEKFPFHLRDYGVPMRHYINWVLETCAAASEPNIHHSSQTSSSSSSSSAGDQPPTLLSMNGSPITAAGKDMREDVGEEQGDAKDDEEDDGCIFGSQTPPATKPTHHLIQMGGRGELNGTTGGEEEEGVAASAGATNGIGVLLATREEVSFFVRDCRYDTLVFLSDPRQYVFTSFPSDGPVPDQLHAFCRSLWEDMGRCHPWLGAVNWWHDVDPVMWQAMAKTKLALEAEEAAKRKGNGDDIHHRSYRLSTGSNLISLTDPRWVPIVRGKWLKQKWRLRPEYYAKEMRYGVLELCY